MFASLIQFMTNISSQLASLMAPHLYHISLTIIVCVIALYANNVNKLIKRFVGRQHFLVRTCVFVIVTAFGYAALTFFATPWLLKLLNMFGSVYLPWLVFSAFVILGILADRKNQI